jgi:hypothetical protein
VAGSAAQNADDQDILSLAYKALTSSRQSTLRIVNALLDDKSTPAWNENAGTFHIPFSTPVNVRNFLRMSGIGVSTFSAM